jgi:hypothetical protein
MSADDHPRPTDAFTSPRFGQLATFMRLPHLTSPAGLDVALYGIPFDGGCSAFLTEPRFAPSASNRTSERVNGCAGLATTPISASGKRIKRRWRARIGAGFTGNKPFHPLKPLLSLSKNMARQNIAPRRRRWRVRWPGDHSGTFLKI